MIRLADLVRLLNGDPSGNLNTPITGAAALAEAAAGDITFAADRKYVKLATTTQAAAVIVPRDFPDMEKPLIRVSDPRLAWAQVLELFAPAEMIPLGVHHTASLGEDVVLGKDVSVQALAYVGSRARLGGRVVVHPGVFIGEDVEVGENTVIYPNAVIRERVRIGRNCIIHAGAVLGADGFGFVPTPEGHRKVPHIGTVVIEDDVEIGANTTIDRGTTGATRVGRGTKLDNLVQVGHNVQIGADCLLAGLAGLAGSTVVQDRVTMGGQSGAAGHLTMGAGSVVLARGLVAGDLPPRAMVSGFPARPHGENMRILAEERRLPEVRKDVGAMKQQLGGVVSGQELLTQDVRELERMLERLTSAHEQMKERLADLERALGRKDEAARGDKG